LPGVRTPVSSGPKDDQVITLRLHGNDEDHARKLNRTENLRPTPPGDPDFERLFPRRNESESINRELDDTMSPRRARPIHRSPEAPDGGAEVRADKEVGRDARPRTRIAIVAPSSVGKIAKKCRQPPAGRWARGDLNPHVLADTGT
jgi:hypothetical protein